MTDKVKKICIAACAATLLGVSAVAATNIYNANAETELIFPVAYTIESEYAYGQSFIVPDPKTVQIETGTLVTNATSVILEYPDGTAKSEGEYTLDKTGTYTLTYYNANGVSAAQTFVVNKRYYEVGKQSSAKYKENLSCKESADGISVTLKSGESFSFNKPINLNDYTGGELDVCKIYPKFRKEYDVDPAATIVSVKLLDCYDPSKFVEFYVWCGSAGNAPYYVGAGASTQMLTGFEQNKTKPDQMTEEYNGEMYKIHRVRRYQSLSTYGRWLSSRYDDELARHDGISFIWDMSNHQMKARNGGTTYLITDIDSSEVYGTNTFDYDSFFTTGEVILNVEAYNYASTSFDVEIESVFGMSGEMLKDGTVLDTVAPEIFVDVETTADNMIYLQKGKAVTLPKISNVLDYNYYGECNVAVYRNYGKAGQSSVKVQDGVFTPTAIGNYTAVYTAKDSYGNETTYLLEMASFDEQNIVYEIEPLTKLVAAETNKIPYVQSSGLNKEVEAQVFVTTPNGKQIEVEYNGVDGYAYIPEYVGEYTITYCFKDNVYVEENSYKVTCVDENSAAFKNPFNLPNYLMKGASYTLKSVVAYTAGDGAFQENKATVSVSVDGGAYQTLSETQMQAYKVDANQTLQFKASYQNNSVESKVYTVVDVGYGKKSTQKDYLGYMQGNYTAAELSENGAAYSFADGTANLQFINPISSKNLELGFTLSASEAKDVTITLRDANNPEGNYIIYEYQKTSGENISLTMREYADGKLTAQGGVYTKHRGWNGTYSLVNTSEGLNVEGALIEGLRTFAQDAALLEITVTEAKDFTILLSQLNNQTFNSSLRESRPELSFIEKNGVQEGNGIYEILPCFANAVMSPVLAQGVTVTVTAPNGEIVSSVDGVRLENAVADRIYNVKLSQVGQYRVSYAATCNGSNRNGETKLENSDFYIVNVSESVAPTITFKDGSNAQTTVNVKLGSTHKIKDFTATDNVTASENLKVYKMVLDERLIIEENGFCVDSYTFRNVGKYVVCILVYDEFGNSSASYYNVVVS